MIDKPPTYGTWHKDAEREYRMGAGHSPYWRHFISSVPEIDLSEKSVLDFGCNQGGFLRLLHAMRPFRCGLGIDIASESIAVAKSQTGTMPIEYEVAADLAPWEDQIDVAFSYEVIYLLPDLRRHAEQIHQVLRAGGVYHAVTGCHTESHLWLLWRQVLAETSNAPVHDYSPQDYIDAFADRGFAVSFNRFGYDGFVPAPTGSPYYPKAIDALIYPAEDKLLFRLVKPWE